MDTRATIEILEALASGYSPITGEMLNADSVLVERDVIRALPIAVIELENISTDPINVEICEYEINEVIQLFNEHTLNFTPSRLSGFFLGTRKFKNDKLVKHALYGKYKNVYMKGELSDFMTSYLSSHNKNVKKRDNKPWSDITFFRDVTFNRLSEKGIIQLKNKIKEMGMIKTENLEDAVIYARKKHPRSHEPWAKREEELLNKAMAYTNDLSLLSTCFGRSKGAIESHGQKMIYEHEQKEEIKL